MTIVQHFEALGRQAEDAADAGRSDRLAALLAERDALLAQLAASLAVQPGPADPGVVEAVAGAGVSTSTLISKVAERTDALRRELRELGRGERAAEAYMHVPATRGQLNARR